MAPDSHRTPQSDVVRGRIEIVLPAWALSTVLELTFDLEDRDVHVETARALRGLVAMWTAAELALVRGMLAAGRDPFASRVVFGTRELLDQIAAELDPRMRDCIPLRLWSVERDGAEPQPVIRPVASTLPPPEPEDARSPRETPRRAPARPLAADQQTGLVWHKSSYSSQGNGYDCVETAVLPDGVALRDSKNPDGPAHAFTTAAWRGLLDSVRDRTVAGAPD
jgi:hypothetical protein